MKKHTMKHGLSALCLVLALCMAFQSVTLAADVSADTSADTSVVAEEAESTDANETSDTEEAEADASTSDEAEAEEETPAEEAETDPSEEADPVETDPAEDAEAEEADGETEDEADALVTAQATVTTGWVQVTDDEGSAYWTFSYLENSTVTAATQAADEVLYIPNDITVDTTTFTKGYYYFDVDGKLVADGVTASVGVVEVLKASSGSYLSNASADDSGKVVQVVATQTTADDGAVTVASTMSYYTGQYNDLWYYNGETYTGYLRRTSDDTVWDVTDGVGGTKLTG
ncbi:MAG: hypothetical protein LUE89_09855, partial [Clostridiales bacterium]|nr:hypothetical protein [Clostridiales bacterium]